MKKIIIVLLISTMSFAASASELGSWALGVSYGNVNNWNSVFGLELKTPSFFNGDNNSVSAALDIDMRDFGFDSIDPAYLLSASAMFRRHLYKDLVSSYMKFGLGYAFVDEILHEDSGFIFIPIAFGVDLITFEKDGKYGSFFAETGFNLDFIDSEDNSDIHDGVIINLGVRTFF